MTLEYRDLLMIGVGLVTLFSPPSNIGPFAAICGRYPAAEHGRIARRVAMIYTASCLGCVWFGQWVFLLLGISASSLMATGGLILLLQAALPMAFRGEAPRPVAAVGLDDDGGPQWRQQLFTPLFFPLTFGGATASYLVAEASRLPGLLDKTALSGVCLVCAVIVGMTIRLAAPLDAKMGDAGREIVIRASGLVLVAIAIQLLVRGITELALRYGLADIMG